MVAAHLAIQSRNTRCRSPLIHPIGFSIVVRKSPRTWEAADVNERFDLMLPEQVEKMFQRVVGVSAGKYFDVAHLLANNLHDQGNRTNKTSDADN